MVEINGKLASGFVIDSYQKVIKNNNIRSQSEKIRDNIGLNKDEDRGFNQQNDDIIANSDVTFPRKANINYNSRLQELNSENLNRQRDLNDRRNSEELRNRALRERGVGLNINILI